MKERCQHCIVLLRTSDLSRIQRLDHHASLSIICHEHSATFQDSLQSFDHLMEAGRSTEFLRKTCDTEVGLFSTLDDLHDLRSKCHFLHVKDYSMLAVKHTSSLSGSLTILRSHLSKHSVSLLVHLKISDTITLPLLENRNNFLSCSTI